ncbi:unnamed protein product [Linum tenue]|uniref:Uncharacterized protein n=1 Tax=Linum tenue TaxID=586396 RepID=A0AAV0KTT1_9ROSI|nr:unnamed protein product [Linum tenue]
MLLWKHLCAQEVGCKLSWLEMMLLLKQECWKDVSPLQVKSIWFSSNLMLKLLKSKPLVSSLCFV